MAYLNLISQATKFSGKKNPPIFLPIIKNLKKNEFLGHTHCYSPQVLVLISTLVRKMFIN